MQGVGGNWVGTYGLLQVEQLQSRIVVAEHVWLRSGSCGRKQRVETGVRAASKVFLRLQQAARVRCLRADLAEGGKLPLCNAIRNLWMVCLRVSHVAAARRARTRARAFSSTLAVSLRGPLRSHATSVSLVRGRGVKEALARVPGLQGVLSLGAAVLLQP
jgi:hypothetical protein